MIHYKLLVLALTTALSLTGIIPSFAFAQDTVSAIPDGAFVIEPGKSEIVLEPGESRITQVVVTNRTTKTHTFNTKVEDFTGSNDPSRPVVLLGDEVSPYSLRDYVTVSPAVIVLEPGARQVLEVSINLPEDVEPGGRYGAVLVSTESDPGEGFSGAKLVSQLGSLLLVRVAGDVAESGSITDFRILGDKYFYTSGGPSGFEAVYQNTGNVHLVPYGLVTIENILGQEVANVPVDAFFVLPQSVRGKSVDWEPPFLFGYYKATLEIGRPGVDTEIRTLNFTVLPWPYLVGVLILVALLIWISKTFRLARKG